MSAGFPRFTICNNFRFGVRVTDFSLDFYILFNTCKSNYTSVLRENCSNKIYLFIYIGGRRRVDWIDGIAKMFLYLIVGGWKAERFVRAV